MIRRSTMCRVCEMNPSHTAVTVCQAASFFCTLHSWAAVIQCQPWLSMLFSYPNRCQQVSAFASDAHWIAATPQWKDKRILKVLDWLRNYTCCAARGVCTWHAPFRVLLACVCHISMKPAVDVPVTWQMHLGTLRSRRLQRMALIRDDHAELRADILRQLLHQIICTHSNYLIGLPSMMGTAWKQALVSSATVKPDQALLSCAALLSPGPLQYWHAVSANRSHASAGSLQQVKRHWHAEQPLRSCSCLP